MVAPQVYVIVPSLTGPDDAGKSTDPIKFVPSVTNIFLADELEPVIPII